jgi:hypothetical protein
VISAESTPDVFGNTSKGTLLAVRFAPELDAPAFPRTTTVTFSGGATPAIYRSS